MHRQVPRRAPTLHGTQDICCDGMRFCLNRDASSGLDTRANIVTPVLLGLSCVFPLSEQLLCSRHLCVPHLRFTILPPT